MNKTGKVMIGFIVVIVIVVIILFSTGSFDSSSDTTNNQTTTDTTPQTQLPTETPAVSSSTSMPIVPVNPVPVSTTTETPPVQQVVAPVSTQEETPPVQDTVSISSTPTTTPIKETTSTSAPAPIQITPIEPNRIEGLSLWLDGSDITTLFYSIDNLISRWVNKINNEFDATASSNVAPLIQPSTKNNGLNNLPVINMNGNNHFIVNNNYNDPELTMVVLVKILAGNPRDRLLGIISTDTPGLHGRGIGFRNNQFTIMSNNAFHNDLGLIEQDKWYILNVRYNTTKEAILRINGTSKIVAVDNQPNDNSQGLKIGRWNTSEPSVNMELAEAFVFTRRLLDTEINHIEHYLNRKWNLGLSLPVLELYSPNGQEIPLKKSFQEQNYKCLDGTNWPFLVKYDINEGNSKCASIDSINCISTPKEQCSTFLPKKHSSRNDLRCGEQHLRRHNITGYEDNAHWCNLIRNKETPQPKTLRQLNYRCVGSWQFPVRRTGDTQQDCLSFDSRNCVPPAQGETCSNLLDRSTFTVGTNQLNTNQSKPLFCGVHHEKQHGSTGFQTGHWCQILQNDAKQNANQF